MTDNVFSFLAAFTAIALGVMNYLKHRHMEQDMKNFPLHIALKITFGEDF